MLFFKFDASGYDIFSVAMMHLLMLGEERGVESSLWTCIWRRMKFKFDVIVHVTFIYIQVFVYIMRVSHLICTPTILSPCS